MPSGTALFDIVNKSAAGLFPRPPPLAYSTSTVSRMEGWMPQKAW